MASLEQAERVDLASRIAEFIQEQRIEVGGQLPSIRELSVILGKNASSIRDALLRAQALGWVQVLPRAGAFVRRLPDAEETMIRREESMDRPAVEVHSGVQNPFHLLDARRVLELELGRRAVQRRQVEDLLPIRDTLNAMRQLLVSGELMNFIDLDIRFHLQIAELGGNPVMLRMLHGVLEQLRPHLGQLAWDPLRKDRSEALHSTLYAALLQGDSDQFLSELGRHLGVAYDALLDHVRSVE